MPDFTLVPGFKGLLFIGDAHLTSVRPGRRKDNYAAAILRKLSQAARIANERQLLPVLLGDLFHRARENDLELLSSVKAVAREFEAVPFVLAGSHDRTETWLSSKDALQFLAEDGLFRVIQDPGHVISLLCGNTPVHLYGAPAGTPLPWQLDRPDDQGRGILVSHHDLDFRGMYPGAHALHEIDGCDLLVNGHMHHPAPLVIKDQTACRNPGSISRVSVDLKDHIPVVSVWTPAHGINLEAVPLVHDKAKDVFDFTGKEADAASMAELKHTLPKAMPLSRFAALMSGEHALEAERTEDGSVLLEELAAYFAEANPPAALKNYLTALVDAVNKENTNA